ncbi:DUF3488 and transglutaminase-like domain-containing protein [Uliginosibacterium sediminicola]|uniref:DUF3488 and transglutaminase-like domain-containing protein n=1 Tax=Uliginosibacterium sediminicola TaxID=2024550 RepID=A0ABU9Z0W5_9RHOO
MTEAARIPRALQLQLCALAAITLWPYALFQPWYLSLLAALLIGWRAALAWQDRATPRRLVQLPLALVALALILFAYGNPVGRLPGLAALCQLLPLKLLETQRTRDIRVTLLLAFFLIVGMFLHEQSAIVAIAAGAASLFAIACAARTQRPALPLGESLRLGGRLLGLGLPLMLLLFLLFPRIEGPLWGMPLDAYTGSTGLSDRMDSASISKLVPTGGIAFRASFKGAIPPPAERYWRGPVLGLFNGEEWRPLLAPPRSRASYEEIGRSWDYSITLEPNNLRWLLSLDYPLRSDSGRFSYDNGLIASAPVRQRTRYNLRSYPDIVVGLNESAELLEIMQRLPPGFNPRAIASGEEIGGRWLRAPERLRAVIDLMRSRSLQYTLSPPPTGRNSVDDFLFVTRSGFCEHFAAAFVVLARAAGLSARVVTGYQGGEVNPLDGTLVVRQSDAHAWAEVWLPERGWLRVDPTAESFPRRIDERGLESSLPPSDALPFMVRTDIGWLRNLRYRWEALGNTWNLWVLGYNAQRQMAMLRSLGFADADWRMLVSLMAGSAGLWLLWLIWRLAPKYARADALDRSWQRFCKQMARRGHARHSWETPAAYAARLSLQYPAQADNLQGIAELYARLRYGKLAAHADDISTLRARIKTLSASLGST